MAPKNVAAFIGEPIQGAGGVIIPPASYWPEVRRICAKYGILLVVDEVITGFGRTGRWFASQYYDLEPDLLVMAKGMSSGYLPIGGVMVADRVAQVLADGGDFNHGFTYSGHPTCAAVAARNIELLRDERIVEHVHDVAAPHLAQTLEGTRRSSAGRRSAHARTARRDRTRRRQNDEGAIRAEGACRVKCAGTSQSKTAS